MQQHGSKYFLWIGLKGKEKISECCQFAYQIKGEEVKTNLEAKSLTLRP